MYALSPSCQVFLYKKNFYVDSFEFVGTIITYPYPGALHLYPRGYIGSSRPILLGVLPTNLVNTPIFIIYYLTGIHVYIPPLLTLAIPYRHINIYLYMHLGYTYIITRVNPYLIRCYILNYIKAIDPGPYSSLLFYIKLLATPGAYKNNPLNPHISTINPLI